MQKFCDSTENESCTNAIRCIKTAIKIAASNLMDLKSLNNNDLEVCSLSQTVQKALEMAKIYATSKNITFALDIKNEDVSILADENKFLAALINLIKNAVEAIEDSGKITIFTSVKEDFASIVIANNGAKIPEEKQNKLFEEGFSTKTEGSGLGLYICKKSLEEQFARLELLKSDENSTEFEIQVSIV
jgi:signal transduction histidine kinase